MSNKKEVDPRELLEDMLSQDYKVVSGTRSFIPNRIALQLGEKGNVEVVSKMLPSGEREDVSPKYLESFAGSLFDSLDAATDEEITDLINMFDLGDERKEDLEDLDLQFYEDKIQEYRMEVARLELAYALEKTESLKSQLLQTLERLREIEDEYVLWLATENMESGEKDLDWVGPLTEGASERLECPEDYPYTEDLTLSFVHKPFLQRVDVLTSTGSVYSYRLDTTRYQNIQRMLRQQDLPVVMNVLLTLSPPTLIGFSDTSTGSFVLKGFEEHFTDTEERTVTDKVWNNIQDYYKKVKQENPWTAPFENHACSLYYPDIITYVHLAQSVSVPLYGMDYSVRQYLQHLSATLKPQHEQMKPRPTTRVTVEEDVMKALQEVLSGLVGSDIKLLGEDSIVDMVLQRLATIKG